jgi:hypothetical protein
LCQKAFSIITGIGLRALQTYVAEVKRGVEPNSRAGRREGWEMTKTELARAWLSHYADLHDSMPHKSIRGVTEVHLDSPSKKEVYYIYVNYMVSSGHSYAEDVLPYTSFSRVWGRDFRWLKVKKEKDIKNKCLVCEDLEVSERIRTIGLTHVRWLQQ